MIITIDGPAASGKSTIARLLANKLNCFYLSSGMLYRALAYVLHTKYQYSETLLRAPRHADVQEIIKEIAYQKDEHGIYSLTFQGAPITQYLKMLMVEQAVSLVSADPFVREQLRSKQRELAAEHCTVVEGRDAGTLVFPTAPYKFFLDASLPVRARRWQNDQVVQGERLSLDEAQRLLHERDQRDIHRAIGALKVPIDAHVIDTTDMNIEQVIAKIIYFVSKKPALD